jgi:hypothetical protein
MAAALRQEMVAYANRKQAEGHEHVYYKVQDILNWQSRTDNDTPYYPGLGRAYLSWFHYPRDDAGIRQVFEMLKRCEPLRTRMEQYARKLTGKIDEREHMDALAILSMNASLSQAERDFYQKQYEEERARVYAYPYDTPIELQNPTRYCINLESFNQYETAIAYIAELESGSTEYSVLERRFSMWVHDNDEQNRSLSRGRSKYERSYVSASRSGAVGSSYAAGFYSKYN